MLRLRVYIAAAALMMSLGPGAFAAQQPGAAPTAVPPPRAPHGQVERELQRLRATLKLTDDQVAIIRPILETRNQELKDLRANAAMPQGEARAKAAAIRRAARRQIEHTLTPEQRERQKEIRRRGLRATEEGE